MNFRKGALVTLIGQWGRYALNLASLVVLSRMLGPSSVGLIAMALVVTSLANLLADFGLSLAAIQAKSLDHTQRANLFWLNTAIGVLAAAVVVGLAPTIAAFYRDDRMVAILFWLAGPLILNGISVQSRVQLTRRSRFTFLAWVDFLSALAGFSLAVCVALLGFDYWSLVAQQVVVAATTAVLLLTRGGRLPLKPGRASMRTFITFGANNFGLQLLNFAASNADTVALGRFATPSAVGLYSRAFQIVLLPIQQVLSPLTRVMLPRLAKVVDDSEFNAILQRLQRVASVVSIGALSVLVATAPALIALVLGPSWEASAPYVRVLCIASLFQTLAYFYYWACLSRARTGLLFLSELPGRLILLALIYPAAQTGVLAVCVLVAFQQVIIWCCGTFWAARRIGVQPLKLIQAGLPALAVYVIAAVVTWIADSIYWTTANPAPRFCWGLALWMACVGCSLAIPAVRRAFITAAKGVLGRV
ncbi:lipopolysaccharide biosynthesis protein [Arthrobacter sp. NPDC090010]|uniref:lipopolysaccharide biosynthesis protein n=1 Tax=Arthrobacter sp. NPDC090010 TaxID=3363942 RepID=UPI003818122E